VIGKARQHHCDCLLRNTPALGGLRGQRRKRHDSCDRREGLGYSRRGEVLILLVQLCTLIDGQGEAPAGGAAGADSGGSELVTPEPSTNSGTRTSASFGERWLLHLLGDERRPQIHPAESRAFRWRSAASQRDSVVARTRLRNSATISLSITAHGCLAMTRALYRVAAELDAERGQFTLGAVVGSLTGER
jgi:hypothetical protein